MTSTKFTCTLRIYNRNWCTSRVEQKYIATSLLDYAENIAIQLKFNFVALHAYPLDHSTSKELLVSWYEMSGFVRESAEGNRMKKNFLPRRSRRCPGRTFRILLTNEVNHWYEISLSSASHRFNVERENVNAVLEKSVFGSVIRQSSLIKVSAIRQLPATGSLS